jgi:hypothetical protein
MFMCFSQFVAQRGVAKVAEFRQLGTLTEIQLAYCVHRGNAQHPRFALRQTGSLPIDLSAGNLYPLEENPPLAVAAWGHAG